MTITTALTIGAIALLGYQVLAFGIGTVLGDNSVMDILYGIGIALVPWSIILWSGQEIGVAGALVLTLGSVWALRLSGRILRKNWGKPEDQRYANWREQWLQRGVWYFYARSFIQIYLLQGVIMYVVALPMVLVLAVGASGNPVMWIGVAIWLIGFLYEATADWQLDRFLADPDRTGLMTDGLFRYSRRPNYCGESLQWWGMAVIAAAVVPLWPWSAIAFASPLLITYIVTQVTGPMLERQFEGQPGFDRYRQCVNYFIPGPPRCRPDEV